MSLTIQSLTSETQFWDDYVCNHPDGTLYHLSGWKPVIEKTYGHSTYYLMAFRSHGDAGESSAAGASNPVVADDAAVAGVLPLVHIKHLLFGNGLTSIPFFDLGGILADDAQAEQMLLNEAVQLGLKLGAKVIELRNTKPSKIFESDKATGDIGKDAAVSLYKAANENADSAFTAVTRTHKVRMLLELPEDSETLMKSFKSKLRSQIRKPQKEGLTVQSGDKQLLDDFYQVFVENMRDLGSPVHAEALMRNVLAAFDGQAKIFVVYQNTTPVAASLVVGFQQVLQNPWASSLRRFGRLAPNMLLYWQMLEYGCDHGFRYFDFGRSTPDDGTYRFKQQWGAQPHKMHWHYVNLDGSSEEHSISENSFFEKAADVWKKLPLPVTKIVGPRLRKYIPL